MGTLNIDGNIPLVTPKGSGSPARANSPSSIRSPSGFKLFGSQLANSLAGDLEGFASNINAIFTALQSQGFGNLGVLTSQNGIAPDLITLTIKNGALVISGTGKAVGTGSITVDGPVSSTRTQFKAYVFSSLPTTTVDGAAVYCSDAANILDDAAAPGSIAVAGGHGSLLIRINGTWRITC